MKKNNSTFNLQYSPRGHFVLLVLVFSAVFLTLISSLAGYIFVEKRAQLIKENREKALHVAEAGLEYYRWFLAHFPNDLQDGTGSAGPYEHTVDDPEGGVLGTFSLDIQGEEFCGSFSSIEIKSTGATAADPSITRTVSAVYTRPSIAEFSHIVDSNVWAGDDRVISGPYHSNQGVRMDGTHNATVSSGVDTWECTSSFGCSGTQTVAGVFGDGGPSELWESGVPQVGFSGFTFDLAALENYAEDEGGIFYGPAKGSQNNRGYHVVFNSNGTVTIYRVYDTIGYWGYSTEEGWEYEYNLIDDKRFLGTFDIPDTCPILYFEDRVWVEGVVSGKVVLAASRLGSSIDPDVILEGNLTYADGSETDGIAIIAENNVLVGLSVPNSMTINGIFVAQEGRFGRNHYQTAGSYDVPSSYNGYVYRDTLHTNGTVVSRGRVGTKWTCDGTYCSGFNERYDTYDAQLASSPPPFTPYTSIDYTFRNWQEVE